MIPERELRVWWNAIALDSRFEMIRMFVRASYLDSEPPPNQDQLKGAKLFEALLMTIAAGEETGREVPGPGLNHDLDDPKPVLTGTSQSAPEKKTRAKKPSKRI